MKKKKIKSYNINQKRINHKKWFVFLIIAEAIVFYCCSKVESPSGMNPRCHDPYNLTLYDSFRLFWIFHLFADRHFIPFRHQLVQISFHCMIWNSAHGSFFFLPAVFSGQCNLQFPANPARS